MPPSTFWQLVIDDPCLGNSAKPPRLSQLVTVCAVTKIRCVFSAVISISGAVPEGDFYSLPSPPPPPRDLLRSLQSNPPVSSSVKVNPFSAHELNQ